MKIAILGAGALGSLIGAYLARAGEEVTLIARGKRAKHLHEHGVVVKGLTEFTVHTKVVDRPEEVKEADVLLVAVKTYDMEEALKTVNHVEVGSVLSVQNGVLKNDQLARYFGRGKTLGAAVSISAEVAATGDVRLMLNESLYIGELPEGTSERVQKLANIFANSGIHVEVSPQIQSVEWSKYLVWMSLMVVSVLTRFETHKLLKDPDIASVMVMLGRETAQLSAKLGIPLGDYGRFRAKTFTSVSIEKAVAGFRQIGEMLEAQGATAVKVSSLQDLERGRRIEVEESLGYALQKGIELDVRLPITETCYRLLTGLNRHLS